MSTNKKKEQPYTSKLRGVAALLETNVNDKEETLSAAELIPLDKIIKSSFQPRCYFDPLKQKQLETSVAQHGILEPLLVRPRKTGQYEIVAGERRYLAALAVGLSHLPVVVKELTDTEALQIALIENLQRTDLNPLEETEGILRLLSIEADVTKEETVLLLYRMENETKGKVTQNVLGNEIKQKVIALFDSLGRMSWSSFVSSRLPLLKLPQDILEVLREGKIEYTKAKAIASLKDETARKELMNEAVANSLSLREIKERIKAVKPQPQKEEIFNRLDNTYKQVKKSKKLILENSRKRKKLESLLAQIDKLLEEQTANKKPN